MVDSSDSYLHPEATRADRLSRAKGYPYEIPTRSFVLSDDGLEEPSGRPPPPIPKGTRPLIASGSNQSPEQLRRKFAGRGLGRIVVTRAQLFDHDVFYSAHITRYGSLPATIGPSPGCRVWVNLSWLTPAQEARMHETESVGVNYAFGKLSRLRLQIQEGNLLDEAMTYQSLRGLLLDADGQPISLREIPAEGRRHPSMSQTEVLSLLRDRLAPGTDLDTFIDEMITDHDLREDRTRALARGCRRFTCDGFNAERVSD